MSRLHDTFRNIIRMEKETYDLYRLLDKSRLDSKTLQTLRRCADGACRNLEVLEQKCWEIEPSLAVFLQHFIPDVESVTDISNEQAILDHALRNRKALQGLYESLSLMDDDLGLCEVFREMAQAETEFTDA